MKIRVLIADDHKLIRTGLKQVIDGVASMEVVGEANDGREAILLCEKLKPDVIVMDISMKGLNGIEATKQILQHDESIKVIGLSMHSDKQFILGMFKAGAYGYLLKDCESKEFIEAIKSVHANKKHLTHAVSGVILEEFMSNNTSEDPLLSNREKEVLQLIAEGQSSKEIGEMLFLSSKTIDAHRKNIMDKLKLYTIPELTKYAIKEGLTSVD